MRELLTLVSSVVVVVAHGLGCSWHVGSSQTRDWTHVPCIGRWILNPWTTREVQMYNFYNNSKFHLFKYKIQWSECCSVVSDSLWPHGLYSPWNSPGQNTGVGSLSLLQGSFLTQKLNLSLLHYRRILYQLSYIHNVVPPLQVISEYFYHALSSKKPSLVISHLLFPSTPPTLGHHESFCLYGIAYSW